MVISIIIIINNNIYPMDPSTFWKEVGLGYNLL